MRRLFRVIHSDRGFTLVELLVSMVLLSIVLGVATTMLITIMDTQTRTSARADAQQQNQVGMELLTRLLRQADYPTGASSTSTIITSATATQIVFTSRMNSTAGALSGPTDTLGTTQQFVFSLSGTTLNWASVTPNNASTCAGGTVTCTYTTPTPAHRIVAGVQNQSVANTCTGVTTPTPVFTYYAASTALNGALSTPVASSQLGNINVVQIDLYTKTTTGPLSARCEPLSDYVSLRNWQ